MASETVLAERLFIWTRGGSAVGAKRPRSVLYFKAAPQPPINMAMPSYIGVVTIAVFVAACGTSDPSDSSGKVDQGGPPATSALPSSTTTTSATEAEAQAELTAWRACLTNRIDRLYEETSQKVNEINGDIEGLVAIAEAAESRSYEMLAEGDGAQADMEYVIALQARKQIDELGTEQDELIRHFEETAAKVEATRDGARAGNVDWSLCADSTRAPRP